MQHPCSLVPGSSLKPNGAQSLITCFEASLVPYASFGAASTPRAGTDTALSCWRYPPGQCAMLGLGQQEALSSFPLRGPGAGAMGM